MRGKREMKRKHHPLRIVLGLAAAAGVVAALCWGVGTGWDAAPPDDPTVSAGTVSDEILSTGDVSSPPAQSQAAGSDAPPAVEPPAARDFVISFLGDCTLTSSHYTNHFENVVGDDLTYPFSNVADILTADDLTLANLECSFSERRLESSSEYAFCGHPKYAQSLALGGVECVSMANNHTADFGTAGTDDTAAALEAAGVTGIQGDQSLCFDLRHEGGTTLRIGIYVQRFNGSAEQMKQGAAQLREEGANIVIACMHAGAERIYVPTKRQTALAHAAIQGGADIVIGTHPHILQPTETYQDGLILYSIGNFCFGGNRNPGDKDTVIAQLRVHKDGDELSWEMTYIPCRVSSVANKNDYRPTPYEPDTADYQRCLRKLASPWDTTTAEEAAAAKAAAEATEAAAMDAASSEGVNGADAENTVSGTVDAAEEPADTPSLAPQEEQAP